MRSSSAKRDRGADLSPILRRHDPGPRRRREASAIHSRWPRRFMPGAAPGRGPRSSPPDRRDEEGLSAGATWVPFLTNTTAAGRHQTSRRRRPAAQRRRQVIDMPGTPCLYYVKRSGIGRPRKPRTKQKRTPMPVGRDSRRRLQTGTPEALRARVKDKEVTCRRRDPAIRIRSSASRKLSAPGIAFAGNQARGLSTPATAKSRYWPTFSPDGEERVLWRITSATGGDREVAAGGAPKGVFAAEARSSKRARFLARRQGSGVLDGFVGSRTTRSQSRRVLKARGAIGEGAESLADARRS